MKTNKINTILRSILISRITGEGEELLNMSYDSIDNIPEAYRGLYSQSGEQFVLSGVQGVKTQTDVNNVMESLRKERNDHTQLKQRFSGLGDRDVNEVLTLLDRIPELELAAQGGKTPEELDALLNTRLQTKIAPLQRDMQGLQQTNLDLEAKVKGYETRERRGTIGADVRAACVKAKVLPEAVDDIVMQAERLFEIDESGKVIAGVDSGLTPGIQTSVWLSDLRQNKPFYWPASLGTGRPHLKGGGSGSNPFLKANWNKTEQGRAFVANPEAAKQMAAEAGVEIGASRPNK